MPRGDKRLRTPDGKLNAIYARLQFVRDQSELTQAATAAAIQNSSEWEPLREAVNRILRGDRLVTDIELCAIADSLGCNPIWLMFGYGDPWERPEGFNYKPYTDAGATFQGITIPPPATTEKIKGRRRGRPSAVPEPPSVSRSTNGTQPKAT